MAIDKQGALEIARRALADVSGTQDMVIAEDATIEREFGWVFASSSRAFFATRDPNTAVPGFGPLVVNKDDGSVEFLSTSSSPEQTIEYYNQMWRTRRP